jgi:hypothetical protein
MNPRSLGPLAIVGTVLFACGGGGGSAVDGQDGSSGGSSSGSNGTCVRVDLSTYDTSCNTASDCAYIQAGEVCDGYCPRCGGDAVNAMEQSRYTSAIASLAPTLPCGCFVPPPPQCVDHRCVQSGAADGGAQSEGGGPDGG